LAIVHGISYLHQIKSEKALYSDSRIAMNWVRERRCRSLLKAKQPNLDIWQTVGKAEMWLQRYKVTIPLLKRNTEERGEIPADFGRK
jgi:ribonuclease HI